MNASMQQLSTSNISSARTQCEGFGSRLAINKLPSNRVPSMWRLVVLQNRLTSAGANSDSDLRMRLDGAHGIAPRLGELNWSSMIGLPTDMDLSGCTQIDCCAVTPPVNVPIVSSRRVESDGALEFGERYRAMLAEAAHDIRAPLGVARQILIVSYPEFATTAG